MSELVSPTLIGALDQLVDAIARRVVAGLDERLQTHLQRAEASPWMSTESAARYLDLPKQRLYKLSASGTIPHYKQEGRLLFRRDELDRWLREFAQGPGR